MTGACTRALRARAWPFNEGATEENPYSTPNEPLSMFPLFSAFGVMAEVARPAARRGELLYGVIANQFGVRGMAERRDVIKFVGLQLCIRYGRRRSARASLRHRCDYLLSAQYVLICLKKKNPFISAPPEKFLNNLNSSEDSRFLGSLSLSFFAIQWAKKAIVSDLSCH